MTIDDCSFVVDTGRAKEKSYDPHLKTSSKSFGISTRLQPQISHLLELLSCLSFTASALQPMWVSAASVKQRKGRAGRVKRGVCFHLFSQRRHQSLRPFLESELLRTPLVSTRSTAIPLGHGIPWCNSYMLGSRLPGRNMLAN